MGCLEPARPVGMPRSGSAADIRDWAYLRKVDHFALLWEDPDEWRSQTRDMSF